MSGTPITAKERRIPIAAAGKLATSSQPGEREVVFGRINADLKRLRITSADIFEKALPHPPADVPPGTSGMGSFADATAHRRHRRRALSVSTSTETISRAQSEERRP